MLLTGKGEPKQHLSSMTVFFFFFYMETCPRTFMPHFLNESLLWDFSVAWLGTHLCEKQIQVLLKDLEICANVAIFLGGAFCPSDLS